MSLKMHLSIVLFVVLSITQLAAQNSNISYLPTDSEIANPERGWYDQYQTGDVNYLTLKSETLINSRQNDNITLILRMYYLMGFVNQDSISVEYLENMQTDFDAIREAGVKCIVRFAYSYSQSAAIYDATPEIVLSHISYLSDVLADNSDVIACVQAGFIGVWGEWYYTENFAGAGYGPDEQDQINRRLLVEKLLDILPDNITVQGRTPAIMRNIVESDEPISALEAFDGSKKSRIGHHNDCFGANSTDYGTYFNIEEDLAYLHETTKYTIAGGETCDASNSYSDCENCLEKIKLLHWTYMNRGYNKNVYRKWEAQDCYNEISIGLGYRIRLDSAVVSDTADMDGVLKIKLHLQNVGFAAPSQYKPIQIVLTHVESKNQIILNYSGINNDIRFWLPGEIILDGELDIPSTIDSGNYAVGLRFPDQYTSLSANPAYSIQLANAGLWNNETGINNLNRLVLIGEGSKAELPDVPTDFEAITGSVSQIQLTWNYASGNETGFDIMRSNDSAGDWQFVASLDSGETTYTDENLLHGTSYFYIIRSKNNFGNSNWASFVSAKTFVNTGVDDNILSKVKVYPTYLHQQDLNIVFSDYSEKQIQVRSVSGSIAFEASTNKSKYLVNTSNFSPGLYIVVIHWNNEILTEKITVY